MENVDYIHTVKINYIPVHIADEYREPLPT